MSDNPAYSRETFERLLACNKNLRETNDELNKRVQKVEAELTTLKEENKNLRQWKDDLQEACDRYEAGKIKSFWEVSSLVEANEELKEEAQEQLEQFQRIVDDDRAKDEVHCSCCVELRMEVNKLKVENEAFRKPPTWLCNECAGQWGVSSRAVISRPTYTGET